MLFERCKALSEKDLDKIKAEDASLYEAITGSGHMNSREICFKILKTLKTGEIYFISRLSGLSMRMVYENNDWVFDPRTHQQYEQEDFIKKFPFLIWRRRSWKYEDVRGIAYNEFCERYGLRI